MLISFNSHGETIFCSGMLSDIPQLDTFKRVGNGFQYIGNTTWDLDYVYENEEYLVIQHYWKDAVSTFRIFKKYPRQIHMVLIEPDGLIEYTGNCKFID